MFVKHLADYDGIQPISEEKARSILNDCLALVREENSGVIILNLVYTITDTHKIEMHYAMRGEHGISPMGFVLREYKSLAQLKVFMVLDFSKLEYPR